MARVQLTPCFWLMVSALLTVLMLQVSADSTEEDDIRCVCVPSSYCQPPHYHEIASADTCSEDPDEVCCLRKEVNAHSCGHYKDDDQSKFPWHVAISSSSSKQLIGSGALVHPGVVLTAAHLLEGLKESDIYLKLNSINPEGKSLTLLAQKIIKHEKFRKIHLVNDIALIFLQRAVNLTAHNNIRPLCLPNQGDHFETKTCLLSSWKPQQNEEEDKIKYEVVKSKQFILPRNQCQNDFRTSSRFPPWFHLHSSFMCAIPSAPNKRLCRQGEGGNAGAPLICKISDGDKEAGVDGYYAQVGVASWSPECDVIAPTVFTSVARFRDWIDDYIVRIHDGIDTFRL